jgi:hypothetical protein
LALDGLSIKSTSNSWSAKAIVLMDFNGNQFESSVSAMSHTIDPIVSVHFYQSTAQTYSPRSRWRRDF